MSADWPYTFVDAIRYGDLDANGHLNNVAVHQFYESARVAYMRDLMQTQSGAGDALGVIFAETHVNFRSPGFYPETLHIDVRPEQLARSSVRIAFRIRTGEDDRLVAEGWGTLVGFDYAAGRAAPLSPALTAALSAAIHPEET